MTTSGSPVPLPPSTPTEAGVARGRSGACSWKKQRDVCTSSTLKNGGADSRQRSAASAHRGAKMQPVMVWPGVGKNPGMVSSRSASLRCPSRGRHRSSPTVYGCRGSSNTRRAGPSSTSSPAYSTPTRSHILAITARLWLMNSTDVSNSWRRAATRSSTSASTVASSAVVGSSRISSDGETASAIAMTTRCAIPPDSSYGYRRMTRPGSGDLHLAQHLLGRCRRLVRRLPGDPEHLGDLPARPQRRVERPPRFLVDHRHRAGPQVAQRRGVHRQRVQPVDADRPGAHPAVAGQVTHQRERDRGLAGPGLAHQPVRFAAADLERHVPQGEAVLPAHPVGDVQVGHGQRRIASRAGAPRPGPPPPDRRAGSVVMRPAPARSSRRSG